MSRMPIRALMAFSKVAALSNYAAGGVLCRRHCRHHGRGLRALPALLTVQARPATVNGLAGLVLREETVQSTPLPSNMTATASSQSISYAIRKNCVTCGFDCRTLRRRGPCPLQGCPHCG
jgi:hypothetical protein